MLGKACSVSAAKQAMLPQTVMKIPRCQRETRGEAYGEEKRASKQSSSSRRPRTGVVAGGKQLANSYCHGVAMRIAESTQGRPAACKTRAFLPKSKNSRGNYRQLILYQSNLDGNFSEQGVAEEATPGTPENRVYKKRPVSHLLLAISLPTTSSSNPPLPPPWMHATEKKREFTMNPLCSAFDTYFHQYRENHAKMSAPAIPLFPPNA